MTATGLSFCKKEMLLRLRYVPATQKSISACKDLIQRRFMQCSLAIGKGEIAVLGF